MTASRPQPLLPDEVRVFWTLTSVDLAPRMLSELLEPVELEASKRFRFAKDRLEYLVTRVLVRRVLARCSDRDPAGLRFTRNAHGRPALVGGGALRFNLTNTPDLVACAVTLDREIGVDAEPYARHANVHDIASSVFVAAEREAMATLASSDAKNRRALQLWTLKEAYMKARGKGMAIAPDSFAIRFEDATPSLDLSTLTDDLAARWSMTTHELEGHCLSLCVERTPVEVSVAFEWFALATAGLEPGAGNA